MAFRSLISLALLGRPFARCPLRVASVLLAAASACGGTLPTPKLGPHPAGSSMYVQVPYPPPAAHVEFVPPKPRDDAVWVDGQWNWQGRRWSWEPGGWVVPPPGSYFAPWLTVRLGNGTLLFLPASWHKDDGTDIPSPAPLIPASQAPSGDDAP